MLKSVNLLERITFIHLVIHQIEVIERYARWWTTLPKWYYENNPKPSNDAVDFIISDDSDAAVGS